MDLLPNAWQCVADRRGPWTLKDGNIPGLSIRDGRATFTFETRQGVPLVGLYNPNAYRYSFLRNIARIAEEPWTMAMVIATFGSLDTARFESGHSEEISDWERAAGKANEIVEAVDAIEAREAGVAGDLFGGLFETLLRGVNEHAGLGARFDSQRTDSGYEKAANWAASCDGLMGFAYFEAIEDLFGLHLGAARTYIECPECRRFIRQERSNQKYCGRPCMTRASRMRREDV